jgi:hypothetical protein
VLEMLLQWRHETIGYGQPTRTHRMTPVLDAVNANVRPALLCLLDLLDTENFGSCESHGGLLR